MLTNNLSGNSADSPALGLNSRPARVCQFMSGYRCGCCEINFTDMSKSSNENREVVVGVECIGSLVVFGGRLYAH